VPSIDNNTLVHREDLIRSFFMYLLCALAIGTSSGQEASKPGDTPKVSSWVMATHLLNTVTPESPKNPIAQCSSAVVNLDVVIEEDGSVSSVKVTSGWEGLQDSAMKAVKQWTYKPYMTNGVPTRVETTVMVLYPHDGKPGPMVVPDGKGGFKGGKFTPMPPECAQQNDSKPAPPK
jgi:TonB family protein